MWTVVTVVKDEVLLHSKDSMMGGWWVWKERLPLFFCHSLTWTSYREKQMFSFLLSAFAFSPYSLSLSHTSVVIRRIDDSL